MYYEPHPIYTHSVVYPEEHIFEEPYHMPVETVIPGHVPVYTEPTIIYSKEDSRRPFLEKAKRLIESGEYTEFQRLVENPRARKELPSILEFTVENDYPDEMYLLIQRVKPDLKLLYLAVAEGSNRSLQSLLRHVFLSEDDKLVLLTLARKVSNNRAVTLLMNN